MSTSLLEMRNQFKTFAERLEQINKMAQTEIQKPPRPLGKMWTREEIVAEKVQEHNFRLFSTLTLFPHYLFNNGTSTLIKDWERYNKAKIQMGLESESKVLKFYQDNPTELEKAKSEVGEYIRDCSKKLKA